MKGSDIGGFLVDGTASIVEAMKRIDSNCRGILFVVDEKGCLVGSVTDGDIRRWLIRTGDLSARVLQCMHCPPKYLCIGERGRAKSYMQEQMVKALPILDAEKKVQEVIFDTYASDDIEKRKKGTLEGTHVIIMAGGRGSRLLPYTKVLPKPLIPIGDVPIIERIINRFYEYGIEEYYLTVNYKKGMIKSYFMDMSPAYRVNFVEEDKPLGTAGSIRLIQEEFRGPVIVTNCDILIDADYKDIMEFHKRSGNSMTIVSALKNMVVPYGVLHSKEGGVITSMDEKPSISYFINTGMYVLNPEIILKIPKGEFFHMTDLAGLLIKEERKVGMYPVSEDSFLDMGEMKEMRRMEQKLNLGAE